MVFKNVFKIKRKVYFYNEFKKKISHFSIFLLNMHLLLAIFSVNCEPYFKL